MGVFDAPVRKDTAIGSRRFAVVVLVMLSAALAAAAPSTGGRFVADEIIVKFRVSADIRDEIASSVEPGIPRDLRILQDRYRIREMRPLVQRQDRRQSMPQDAADEEGRRLLSRRRSLIQRRARPAQSHETASPGRVYRIKLDREAGESPEAVLAACRSRPDVEYAEFNPIISICASPNDPWYADQWSLSKVRAYEAWDTCRGDNEVVVAIIDTGVDYRHRDLQGNLWVNEAELNGAPGVDDDGNGYVDDIHGYNFAYSDGDPNDDHGHGTHVAGTVAAAGNNGLDIVGVCWSARIMALKVLGSDGDGSAADAAPAIYYAVANGADVISCSWGSEDGSDVLKEAVVYAHRQGVIVVAAAGNQNSDALYYPACYPEALSVAATDASDSRWIGSNYGDWVDLAAPGRDVLSLRRGISRPVFGDMYTVRMTGTSMAVPHVSGTCALLLSANPLLTCDELHEILTTTGDPIAAGICASNSRLNVSEALRAGIPPVGTIRLDRDRYPLGGRIGILLADWHLRGAGQQVVLVEAESGDEEAVILTETQVSLGVFRGDIVGRTGTVTLGDGVLQLADGQSIIARYLDGDDGLGHAGQWRQATAQADYAPPAVVDVQVQLRGLTATVGLLTSEPARVEIRYGRTCGGPYELAEKATQWSDLHSIDLTGLSPQTKYCFVVALTDEAGNETLADDGGQPYSFTTSGRARALRVRERSLR